MLLDSYYIQWRMKGIPLSDPSYFNWDNMSVLHNISELESVIRKKGYSICYHAVNESVAMGECLGGHVSSKENVTDSMTKVLCG